MSLIKPILTFLATSAIILAGYSQDKQDQKLTLDGYVTFLETVMDLDSAGGFWIYETQLHNRLNINYVPVSRLSFSLQARNRLITGDRFRSDPGDLNKKAMERDPGLADMSFNIASGKSYVLNSSVDRLWMKYTVNQFEATVGRQRINWGLTWVWNPNDWFNNFSFFDVDYPERPGSDAIRLRYFTGPLSSGELVLKADSTGKLTAAGQYRFNRGRYDFQVQGGILASDDAGLGIGWAGGIGNMGFRGELSYFHPLRKFTDSAGLFLVSVALDYTFDNSLSFQFEGLYNQQPGGNRITDFMSFYQRPLTVKDLSFTEWNLFAQVSYPFTPLLNASLAVLYFPGIKGYYIGPSVTWSLGDNLDFSFIIQMFDGKLPDRGRQTFTLGFLRFKYSF